MADVPPLQCHDRHCAICNGRWVKVFTMRDPGEACPYCGYVPPRDAGPAGR